ncbi:MAG: hypothetical protein CVV05_00115 [Gammaproteobacteria bacterium HGW-Gammaproteobacteria-1]|jgi:hypothetical protein|nr:MAG: hypothetical protein CVV05_00115 [Gammaproteobacteria bacterium HGW-Gammaproteobacteria-1]
MCANYDDCECCADGHEAVQQKIEDNIREHGVAIIFTQTEAAETILNLAYTIGLADIGHPEVLVFALPAESAHMILNDIATRAREVALPMNERLDDLANLPLILKPVAPSIAAEYIVQANARAGRELPALQLVWPDARGLFPWEEGFEQRLLAAQPHLYGITH